jgi:2',3'-cyclic-nucleotide 2'-phosphodiesterase (5'-nucleotidase family)
MQHGEEAYKQTLNAINSFGSLYFSSKEKKSLIFEHQGKNVSLTGFSLRPDNFTDKPLYWSLPENCELEEELHSLKQQGANFHIAFIHGGIEFINYPYNDEKTFYRSIIDMGYDMVIGMHPHVLQGYEFWHGKYIFYSLGNFLFNMPWYKTKYGAIVNVDFAGTEPKVSCDYIKISDDLQPYIVVESEVAEDCRFEHLNKLLSINEENEKYFSHAQEALAAYEKVNRKWILGNFRKMPKIIVKEMLADFIKRRF